MTVVDANFKAVNFARAVVSVICYSDLKIVILGTADVGKTTLIHRYIEGNFQKTISVCTYMNLQLKLKNTYTRIYYNTVMWLLN